MLTFLHLSDLHISIKDADTQFDREVKLRAALLADLGKEGREEFDGVFITGDITFGGRAVEFERANTWLEEVRKATNSSPEALFVVPGNHDVNRSIVSKGSALWALHQILREEMSPEERLDNLSKKLTDQSFDFLTGLAEYNAFSAAYDCPTMTNELAWVRVFGADKELEDGTRVRLHGLNSVLISDGEDKKANLFLSEFQFRHFDSKPEYVNVVLCHHPPSWLIDGNEANDFFRNQSQVVLCGHEHETRCYMEDKSLRLFAGAVHPSKSEPSWNPCYHVLRLSIDKSVKRELVVNIETRDWNDKEKVFLPHVETDGKIYLEKRIELPPWNRRTPLAELTKPSFPMESPVSLQQGGAMTSSQSIDFIAAARRKLIVHFFRLGPVVRYQVAMKAGVWQDSYDDLVGQARWAKVFENAEKNEKLGLMWNAVASEDQTLAGQINPFEKK